MKSGDPQQWISAVSSANSENSRLNCLKKIKSDDQLCRLLPATLVWENTKDVVEVRAPSSIKHAVLRVWTKMIECQKYLPLDDRLRMYHSVTQISAVDDLPDAIEVLIMITSQGSDINEIACDITKLLTHWFIVIFHKIDALRSHSHLNGKAKAFLRTLTQSFYQLLLLFTNIVRLRFYLLEELDVSAMVANCVWMCKNTTKENDIEMAFSLIGYIISYGYIATSVLPSVVEVLCRAKSGLIKSSQTAHSLIDKLFRSRMKYHAFRSLMQLVDSPTETSTIAIIGAIRILGAYVVRPPETVYCERNMIFEFFLKAMESNSLRVALEASRSLFDALGDRHVLKKLSPEDWKLFVSVLLRSTSYLPHSLNYKNRSIQEKENVLDMLAAYNMKLIFVIKECYEQRPTYPVPYDEFYQLLKVSLPYMDKELHGLFFEIISKFRILFPSKPDWLDDQKLLMQQYMNSKLDANDKMAIIDVFNESLFHAPEHLRDELFRITLIPLLRTLKKESRQHVLDKIFQSVCDSSILFSSDIFQTVSKELTSIVRDPPSAALQYCCIQTLMSMLFLYVLPPTFKASLLETLANVVSEVSIPLKFRILPLITLLQLRVSTTNYLFVNPVPAESRLLFEFDALPIIWYAPNKTKFSHQQLLRDLDFSKLDVLQEYPLKVNTTGSQSDELLTFPVHIWMQSIIRFQKTETNWNVLKYAIMNFANQLRSMSLFKNDAEGLQLVFSFISEVIQGEKVLSAQAPSSKDVQLMMVTVSEFLSVLMIYKDVLREDVKEQFFLLLNSLIGHSEKAVESCIDALIINIYEMPSHSLKYLPKFFTRIISADISERTLVNFLRLLHVVGNSSLLGRGLPFATIKEICLFCFSIVANRKQILHNAKGLMDPGTRVFSLYIVSFCYQIVTNMFLSCPLQDRAELSQFLLNQLLSGDDSRFLEPYEVVFYEFLLSFTYSNELVADTSKYEYIDFDPSAMLWLYRGCVITILQTDEELFKLQVRRMSGVQTYAISRTVHSPQTSSSRYVHLKHSPTKHLLFTSNLDETTPSHIFGELIHTPETAKTEEPVLLDNRDESTLQLLDRLDATVVRPVVHVAVAFANTDAKHANVTVGWQVFHRLLESLGSKTLNPNDQGATYFWKSKMSNIVFHQIDIEKDAFPSALYSAFLVFGTDDLVNKLAQKLSRCNVPVLLKVSLDSHLDNLAMFDTLFHMRIQLITTGLDLAHQGFWKFNQIVSVHSLPAILHSFIMDIGLYQSVSENFYYVHPWLERQKCLESLYKLYNKRIDRSVYMKQSQKETLDFTLYL
ncbi:GTPase activating protein [Schizosaccharomyces japonicus yFS275]|uniref:GTPase activating protein n=1 Tax=Schizosaccharomyces japonicus (strain yFS275 / FY16936) TaxID=402676 RepID=B6JV83_SCHJY|nr:GTPase activating protein [Schizosaccharomyces japonicus yFS275]EEB05284.1 GTPase activating protein [Schizosaccharomyces japonicus yFS275]